MERARWLTSAFFFAAGCAAFASLPHLHEKESQRWRGAEPYFRSPVPVVSNVAMIRNDASGKGRFGASRGSAKNPRTHQGLDLLARVGNPVYAAKSGRVRYAGIGRGYGWYVELGHPDGRISRYAHLERVEVLRGEWVTAGARIGSAGKSGNADDPAMRPHLHFEIRENGKSVDPLGGLMDPVLKVR